MSTLSKILVSFENYQEFQELNLLIDNLKLENKYQFILFDTGNIFKNENVLEIENYSKVYNSVNKYNQPFKYMSFHKKLNVLFKNMILLNNIIKKEKIDIMITGVPLSFFRYVRILTNKKLIYISYLRSLIIDNGISYSISGRISTIMKNIPILNKSNLFNNWYCDYVFTIGQLNKDFLLKQKVEEHKILLSGSLLLDRYRNNIISNTEIKNKEIVLLTTAFLWHNNVEADRDQIAFTHKFITYFFEKLSDRFKLSLKIHPRDNIDNYNKIIDKYNIKIENRNINEFMLSCTSNKILISSVSSLNLEWQYLGGPTIYYTTPYIYKKYYNFYSRLNIEPFFNIDDIFMHLNKNGLKLDKVNIENIYSKHENGNIKYVKDFILNLKLRK